MSGAAIGLFLKRWLLPLLTFGITLPVWFFLAAGLWLWWDKTSAVRTAVDKAVTELVAGAQLDAMQAELNEERRLRAWNDGKADEARRFADEERSAREAVETKLTQTDAEKRKAENELAVLQDRVDGLVDQQLLDSLHNR
ncbi:hypothetical protein LJR234_000340 [Mesorhizobium amorphae]|uniref:hypothetical protein n=1 Tax=Mesorhizobium amorphae TaxID=71433 RepID=UPI003ECDB574